MKKRLLLVPLLLACISLQAQVVIINDNMLNGRMSTIKAAVLDSLTNEPVPFASVYLVPSKDTTITNFTLTDDKGEARLEDVPYGSYVFHVEMLGYKPFVKEKYFRERREDMGTIKMKIDEQFLQAATVSAVGNPIVIKQDTVEFNASSFRVGSNAMLKDLLKRMPGMEITEDGKVKFNGEAIDQLTVGGRTFFFSDQSTALNNLPASVVDKIRVIDRDSKSTRATGVQDGAKEKVLDVALKKEYEKGWFGNVGLKGGSTIGGKDEESPLRDERGLLWSGNALASAYNEKDQLTIIANGQNVNDSNNVVMVIRSNGVRSTNFYQGLSSAAQLGVNANTSRIKDVETTVGVNYKYTDTDSGSSNSRTTYMDDGNLLSMNENRGKQYANGVSANVEMKKETGKVWFELEPSFYYGKTDESSSGKTESSRDGTFANRSDSQVHSTEEQSTAEISSSVTFKELWGKKSRSIRLDLGGSYGVSSDFSDETTILETAGDYSTKSISYTGSRNVRTLRGSINYVEPFGEKWLLSTSLGLDYSNTERIRDAIEDLRHNDYYSSESRNNNLEQIYDLTLQYKFSNKSWITFGAKLSGVLNETFSKSYGISKETGEGEWLWFVTPSMRIRHSVQNDRLNVNISGWTNKPSVYNLLPVLDISDPSRLSMGNIYLQPSSNAYVSASWSRNNRERFSTLQLGLYGNIVTNPVSYARWYDSDGIMYSIPVNAKKPTMSASLYGSFTTPLDKDKIWSLTLSNVNGFSSSVNYQSRGTLTAIDKEAFDYSAFMEDFWGGSKGNRFYGGQSGFSESNTISVSPYASISVKYNQDHYSFSIGSTAQGRISRYSLDPSINMNTLDGSFFADGSYTTKHEFEFNTNITYAFHKGYAEGYGLPEWIWNAEISKNIGAFNLSIKAYDILNQKRNLTHTVTANYEEDSYRLVMGRYIMFGVKWNFGKMNAAQSMKAQQAAWNMAF